MGLVLFFFHYAHFTKNVLYSDCSLDFISKLQSRIHDATPVDYKQGVTGIGSAFEYLVQIGFVNADTDNILEEFDKRIFSIPHLHVLPLDELLGIGEYALWRLSGNSSQKDAILKTILPKVVCFMEKKSKNLEIEHSTVSFFKNIVASDTGLNFQDYSKTSDWNHRNCMNNPYRLESKMYIRLLEQFSKTETFGKITFSMGIQNGFAGGYRVYMMLFRKFCIIFAANFNAI